MELSEVEAVVEFLRKNGLSEAESALVQDISENSRFESSDFGRFLFPMVTPPPTLKILTTRRPAEVLLDDLGNCSSASSSSSSSKYEFVSLASSTTELCSSEFTNPYGVRTTSKSSSPASSDRLSQFGTARDYPDFDMQDDLFRYREKGEEFFMPPLFRGSYCTDEPSEDKFIMTVETGMEGESQKSLNQVAGGLKSKGITDHLDLQWSLALMDEVKGDIYKNGSLMNTEYPREGVVEKREEECVINGCSTPLRGFLAADELRNRELTEDAGKVYRPNEERRSQSYIYHSTRTSCAPDYIYDSTSTSDHYDYLPIENENYKPEDYRELAGEPLEPDAAAYDEENDTSDKLVMYETNENDYEIFPLRIIHRKNRTGFEENRDLPIILGQIIASRYYVTEYLGSDAFSKVVQARDLYTGMDVCLKIIKNDKDFFDQSLDEIKLLKFANKNDPGDECHIIRLYDYFYHQEHLFIVTELLRANLNECQKFNRESGGETYFTLSRLQVITRQCLEALEFLHGLGIIHCDLKPENILIKSFTRSEIKVIDLGSSCFQTDNLSLYVQSRSYRAPEVILGLPYDYKIDLWSLGCILAELCSGEVLFPNEGLAMLLARVIGMLGPIEMDMLLRGQETPKYFTKEYDLYHMNEDTDQIEYIIPKESSSLENHLPLSDSEFIHFVRHLLEINPKRRPTAKEALQHPWLHHSYRDPMEELPDQIISSTCAVEVGTSPMTRTYIYDTHIGRVYVLV